jgi:hypothetical protein
MKKILIFSSVALLVLIGVLGTAWWGTAAGWWGAERDAGVIDGERLPQDVIARRAADVASVRPSAQLKQILFGDLHVHTTYSTDAFQWALPLNGGPGGFPLADACDFARYCASLDFWAITDHAEASTPVRWQRTKDSIRQCQAVAGTGSEPDMVSYVGFEWTQVGRTPDDHYGHQNVIFRDLDDAAIAARPIASSGLTTQALRTTATGLRPGVLALDPEHASVYLDFNTFLRKVREVPECRADTKSGELPAGCYEQAATPGELVRRLDEQGLAPLVIPHGSTWGFYTPPGTTWDKALNASERPDRSRLVEIYSGHGNSEEYRAWREVLRGPRTAAGPTAICPAPTASHTPSCWRAGEIIAARCAAEGGRDCAKRAAYARWAHANMGVAGHLAIKGEAPEDWLDAGQCTDCFLPAFNYRPRKSVQYGLAISRFADGEDPARFRWGFVASSDNHRARPGTGYKQVDRRRNTEASGATTERWRRMLIGKDQPKEAKATLIPADRLAQIAGFQLTEFERQTSFFLTGGLAAVHAPRRDRNEIWNALQRREVYATSGQRILLWFDMVDPVTGARLPMGGATATDKAPVFEVKAVGAFKQKPGCPSFDAQGMDSERLRTLCSGECYNPSDERSRITRIEVVRIRPQARPGEPVDGLIEDKFLVHPCPPGTDGCSFRFSDPDHATGKRDAIYYVRAIQEPEPMINAKPIQCERDAAGKCVKAKLCYGDYRSGSSDCRAPAEPRAWSSPIYVDWPRPQRG